MSDNQLRPEHGSKDPETGLFCWRYSGKFRMVALDEFTKLQEKRSKSANIQSRKRKAVKKSNRAFARSPICASYEKNILDLHRKGKSLFYISSIYNMKLSRIKEVIEKENP